MFTLYVQPQHKPLYTYRRQIGLIGWKISNLNLLPMSTSGSRSVKSSASAKVEKITNFPISRILNPWQTLLLLIFLSIDKKGSHSGTTYTHTHARTTWHFISSRQYCKLTSYTIYGLIDFICNCETNESVFKWPRRNDCTNAYKRNINFWIHDVIYSTQTVQNNYMKCEKFHVFIWRVCVCV